MEKEGPAFYFTLAAEKERFRELSDAAFEGIAIHEQGIILDVNQAFVEMFGYERDQLQGMSTLTMAAPESRELVIAKMRSGTEEPYEAVGLRKDGSKFLGQLRGRLIHYQGRAVRVVAIQDISEQKRLEAQVLLSQQLLSMNSLAAGVAHEVNNPLTYVLGNLQMMASTVASLAHRLGNDDHRALAQAIDEALDGTDRVRSIIADLRRLSRPAGDASTPVDLSAVLETAIRICGNEIRHRARLVREFRSAPFVEASELRLVQVFVNLLLNAAQSIDDGRASANEIALRLYSDGAGRAVVEVSDTGKGIAQEVRARLFEPFFSTKSGTGTGLGLSISRSIVASLGGEILLVSKEGPGSTFRVSLPPALEPPLEVAPPAPHAEAGVLQVLQVLIVDDEPTVGQTLARMLTPEHRATAVTGIDQALALIGDGHSFDVILCDLMMPDGSGMDLRARLAVVAPHLLPRMLFMTGGSFTAVADEFVARTDIEVLEKPIRRERLLLALAAIAVR